MKISNFLGKLLLKTPLAGLMIQRILTCAMQDKAGNHKTIGLLLAETPQGEEISTRLIVQRADGDHFPAIPEVKVSIKA